MLHDEGVIYRSNRLVNWSTRLKSAISDIEVGNSHSPSSFPSLCFTGCPGRQGGADGSNIAQCSWLRQED